MGTASKKAVELGISEYFLEPNGDKAVMRVNEKVVVEELGCSFEEIFKKYWSDISTIIKEQSKSSRRVKVLENGNVLVYLHQGKKHIELNRSKHRITVFVVNRNAT